ncbi:hypothetical protein ACHAWT_005196 [Skeletonema menzelii]
MVTACRIPRALALLLLMQHSIQVITSFSCLPAVVSKPKTRILPSLNVAASTSSISTATGEADRAFQLGIQLEKAGLARAASAAFHEAATLYQCYLDHTAAASSTDEENISAPNTNIFQHVTSLSPVEGDSSPSVLAVLAYACIRLAHLSHDAFGDSRAATRLYKLAASIDPLPSAVAYHGIGTSIEGSCHRVNDEVSWRQEMEKAVDAYREASRLGGGGEVLFHLAVVLERLDEVEESEKIMESLRRGESNLSSLVDSWGYVRWHTRRADPQRLSLHRGTKAMLEVALEAAQPLLQHDDGLVCEFGVASGRSARMTQEMLPLDTQIHGRPRN